MIVLLSFGSAACYVLATFVMKRWDAIGNVKAVILVAGALAAAVFLETEALRQARLGHVFIVILGLEASLALLCGWLLLREPYPLHDFVGLLLIVLGVAMIHLAPEAHVANRDEMVLPAALPVGAEHADHAARKTLERKRRLARILRGPADS